MTIWQKVLHSWRRRTRLKQLVVMLVPLKGLGTSDGVAAMWHRILGHAPRQRVIRLEQWCEHLRGIFPPPREKTKFILVLFAHPAPQLTGFAVNRAPGSARDVLLRGWWEDPDVSFELLVAHVCNGAGILTDPGWSDIFPLWVSYNEHISAFYDSAGAVERWNRITQATVNASLDGGSTRGVADRIRFAYIHEMVDIDDAGVVADGDPLNFIYFQGALDALRTSEDES